MRGCSHSPMICSHYYISIISPLKKTTWSPHVCWLHPTKTTAPRSWLPSCGEPIHRPGLGDRSDHRPDLIQNPKKNVEKHGKTWKNIRFWVLECEISWNFQNLNVLYRFFLPWIETHIGRIGIQLNVPIEKNEHLGIQPSKWSCNQQHRNPWRSRSDVIAGYTMSWRASTTQKWWIMVI